MTESQDWRYYDMPMESVRRWADWYGHGLGFFGFVAFASAQCNSPVRYDFGPAAGDGIRFGDPGYVWWFGSAVPAGRGQ